MVYRHSVNNTCLLQNKMAYAVVAPIKVTFFTFQHELLPWSHSKDSVAMHPSCNPKLLWHHLAPCLALLLGGWVVESSSSSFLRKSNWSPLSTLELFL